MDLVADVLVDSVIDTLKLLPFLFLTYLAMEALEHGAGHHVQSAVEKSGHAGPVVGALLGALPQCGFSAMAATLYAGRVVTGGTLVAVILSTSDEMIPVFVAHQVPAARLFAILAVKVVVAIVMGFLVDAIMHFTHHSGDGHTHIHELCEHAHCHCEDDEADDHDDHGHHGHEGHGHHHHGHGLSSIVRSALIHTLQVAAFILVITFVFGLLIEGVGEDAIAAVLADHPMRATFIAALVGLIPNCGASVVITELFLDGTLATGPMIAGLLVSGGVGLLVLWRTNENPRENGTITAFIYAAGVVVGLIVSAFGILL